MSESAVSRCLVYCRLRPSNAKDFEDGGFQLISLPDKKRVVVKDERHYDFDGTFGADSQQEDVFSAIAVPCLSHAFSGFCSALMCYGQTGTGKSFTMCCTKAGSEGIIPRAAQHIFATVAQSPKKKFTIRGQFIQIYRDNLSDLMTEGGRDKVDIHVDKEGCVALAGCSSHELTSVEEFLTFYDTGNARRVVMATAMNPESSRGHSAMVITVESREAADETSATTSGKITFIDLAGYERFSKTGISNANPIMKDEAKTINASLLSLGHVVSALSNGDKHIPWRNSKLTRLLQDSIGGRSRTSIILTIGPSSEHLHETTNSLQFGQRAMAVKVAARMNVTTDFEKLAQKLQAMLDERDEKINLLEVQIRSRDMERADMSERHRRDEMELRDRFEREMEELRAKGGTGEQLRKAEEVFLAEVENLKEQQIEEAEYQEDAHNKTIVTLAAEQQRRDRKKQAEMKLVQEKVVRDLERRLSALQTDGANTELLDALKLVGEKDVVLAARALEVASLHDRVAALTEALRQGGLAVPEDEPPLETFVDISQLEEVQTRLQGEIDAAKVTAIEVRAQLDAALEAVKQRADEVLRLMNENTRLRDLASENGLEEDPGSPVFGMRKFVDVEEFEGMKETLTSEISKLTADLNAAREEKARHHSNNSFATQPPETPRIGRPRAMSRVEASRQAPLKRADDNEVTRLGEKCSGLEKKLVQLTREYNLACSQVTALRERCAEGGLTVEDGVELLPEAAADAVSFMLAAREAEVQGLTDILQKQQLALDAEVAARRQLSAAIEALRRRLPEWESSATDESAEVPQPAPSEAPLSTATFLEMLKSSREASSRAFQLSVPGTSRDEIASLLADKDRLLGERERAIIERDANIQSLSALLEAVSKESQRTGTDLSCLRDVDVGTLTGAAQGAQRLADEQARVLAEDLEAQRVEKERLQRVLDAMSSDRAKDTNAADAIRATLEAEENRTRALQSALSEQVAAAETAAADSSSLMETVIELRQRLCDKEDEVAKMAHELMKIQAEKAEAEQTGLLSAFKKRFQ